MIGFAFCGSFCNHAKALEQLKLLKEKGYDILPVMSETAYSTDTRFGKSEDLIVNVEAVCGRKIIHTIVDAEPVGPIYAPDALIICPCTGNTLAKLAHGITDTAVTMAAKSHLRGDKPLVISLASNDSLSANLSNIGVLLNRKNIYFVPLVQDDAVKKPHSLVADMSQLGQTLENALSGKQQRPVFKS